MSFCGGIALRPSVCSLVAATVVLGDTTSSSPFFLRFSASEMYLGTWPRRNTSTSAELPVAVLEPARYSAKKNIQKAHRIPKFRHKWESKGGVPVSRRPYG